MQAPVAHDYDVVDWLPLTSPVEQLAVTGPGYTAAVQNDPDTTPAELVSRFATLPEEARDSMLSEIRIGLRPESGADVNQNAEIQIFHAPDLAPLDLAAANSASTRARLIEREPVYRARVADLRREGDWLIIEGYPLGPPPIPGGSVILIRIDPGEVPPGPDENSGWEFGMARWRAPYGGWPAVEAGESPAQLSGAMLFQTLYEQDTNPRSILNDGAHNLTSGLEVDPAFTVLWISALLAVLVGGGLLVVRTAGGR